MTQEELRAYLWELEDRRREMDEAIPEDESSEAYTEWAEEHEELEDAIDEVMELLGM